MHIQCGPPGCGLATGFKGVGLVEGHFRKPRVTWKGLGKASRRVARVVTYTAAVVGRCIWEVWEVWPQVWLGGMAGMAVVGRCI